MTEHPIVESRLASFGNAKTDDVRNAGRKAILPLWLGKLPAGPVIFPRAATRGKRAFGLEFFRRAEARIGVARLLKLRRQRAVTAKPAGLVERAFVPIESQPFQAFENCGRQLRLGPIGVSVLNPQDEDAVHPPREQPVVESGPRSANVQVAGGRWCESNSSVSHSSTLERRSLFMIDWI